MGWIIAVWHGSAKLGEGAEPESFLLGWGERGEEFLQNPGLSVGYLKGQFLLHLTWGADKIGIVWWGQLRTKEKGWAACCFRGSQTF